MKRLRLLVCLCLGLSACRGSKTTLTPWASMGGGAVEPARVRVDHDQRTITFSVLVVGPQAPAAMVAIHDQTKHDPAPQPAEGTAARAFLPVTLGDIRGFRPTFHLYGLNLDEALAPVVNDALTKVDGVILAGLTADNVDALSSMVGRTAPDVALAVVGDEGASARFTASTGRTLVFSRPAGADAWMPALKEVARAGLKSLRDRP